MNPKHGIGIRVTPINICVLKERFFFLANCVSHLWFKDFLVIIIQ